jgi:hypothetical protein
MTSRVISTKLRNLSCLTEGAESEKTLAMLDIQRENKRQARYQSGDKAKTVNLTKDCIPSRQEEIHFASRDIRWWFLFICSRLSIIFRSKLTPSNFSCYQNASPSRALVIFTH